ncbi:hotdog family protein [Verrucomicrobia bacterium]|nr:hotdog family protein [Verrucomicrobiota bacterium]
MNELPEISQLLPHDAPMIMIKELVAVGKDRVHCRVLIDESCLFFDHELRTVPGYVGIEFMAQTVAALSGYHTLGRGEQPPIGFLLGGRSYRSELSVFEEGMILDIHGKQLLLNENMASFFCTIEYNGKVKVECELNVFEPPKEIKVRLT